MTLTLSLLLAFWFCVAVYQFGRARFWRMVAERGAVSYTAQQPGKAKIVLMHPKSRETHH
jgi:hypothetical protein